jgi:4,5-DOPA dioxygenase extradiol
MVHNLGMIAWDKMDKPEYGYDWALDINSKFKQLIRSGDHASLIKYETISKDIRLAIPTPDHYLPLMYTLGLKGAKDDVEIFNDKAVAGSLTMTSVRFG